MKLANIETEKQAAAFLSGVVRYELALSVVEQLREAQELAALIAALADEVAELRKAIGIIDDPA